MRPPDVAARASWFPGPVRGPSSFHCDSESPHSRRRALPPHAETPDARSWSWRRQTSGCWAWKRHRTPHCAASATACQSSPKCFAKRHRDQRLTSATARRNCQTTTPVVHQANPDRDEFEGRTRAWLFNIFSGRDRLDRCSTLAHATWVALRQDAGSSSTRHRRVGRQRRGGSALARVQTAGRSNG